MQASKITETLGSGIEVAQLLPNWLPQTETWLYDQVNLLPDSISSHILCEATSNLDQFSLPSAHLHNFEAAGRMRRFWDRALCKMQLRSHLGYAEGVCRQTGTQLLHSHFGNIGWANRKLARKLGMRHVTTFYGLDVNHLPTVDPRWKQRYLDLFADVDRILCEGPHMARCIVALGCPVEKVQVHHLGVRTEEIAFQPRRWREGESLRVLIAASFREKKGVPDALEALGVLRRKVPVEVTIVGDASPEPRSQAEKTRIFAVLDRTGLRSQTRLLGYLTYPELMREAYAHHIFLAPSVTAQDGDTEGGAPISILHMAASGMPIVSTRHCDIPNVLPPGTHLAAEHDVDGLVDELRCLVGRAGTWKAGLSEARWHIEENFNAYRQGRRLGAIYWQLIANGGNAPLQVECSPAQVSQ